MIEASDTLVPVDKKPPDAERYVSLRIILQDANQTHQKFRKEPEYKIDLPMVFPLASEVFELKMG